MTQKPNKLALVLLSIFYFLLAIGGVYWIVLLYPPSMAWYFLLWQFILPFISLLIVVVLSVMTVFLFRIVKKFFYFLPLMIAAYPITYLLLYLVLSGGLNNPFNLTDYFYHIAYQKQYLEEAHHGYDSDHVYIPVDVEDRYDQQDFFTYKAVESDMQPQIKWVRLLKPSLINGADDYLALYDEQKKDYIGIRSTDDIWQEVKTKNHLNVTRTYEHVWFEEINKNQISFEVYRPSLVDYIVDLGTDGTHVVVKKVSYKIPKRY